jgi:hypothetical protein
MRSAAPLLLALCFGVSSAVLAQAPQPPAVPPGPTHVISTAAVQAWQYRQEWHCSNTPTVSQDTVPRMRELATALGGDGWEFVAFSPLMNISALGECFFAMYKRPAPR